VVFEFQPLPDGFHLAPDGAVWFAATAPGLCWVEMALQIEVRAAVEVANGSDRVLDRATRFRLLAR